ncbi:MAG: ribose-phosphate pyrophosphokinase [Desulfurococcales archaeon]|nr:ribose-phosphate pyrophosphokinase [Desulfurococcales archaeon]
MIISLPASLGIGEKLSEILGMEHASVDYKIFPDGESYVRLPVSVEGEEVILVQTTYPSQDKRLIELLLAIDAAVSHGASSISAIIPYMAYARQDKVFIKGEAVSIRTLLRALRSAGLDRIYVIDIHKEDSLKFFGGPAYNIDPVPLFAKVLRNEFSKPVVIAPDLGAEKKAKSLAALLNTEFVVIKKHRDRRTGEVSHELPKALDVRHRDAVIIDDIISTGGTVAKIAKYLKSLNARKVLVVASHGLFVKNALEKLKSSGVDRIYVLRTVDISVSSEFVSVLDPTELIASRIRETLSSK